MPLPTWGSGCQTETGALWLEAIICPQLGGGSRAGVRPSAQAELGYRGLGWRLSPNQTLTVSPSEITANLGRMKYKGHLPNKTLEAAGLPSQCPTEPGLGLWYLGLEPGGSPQGGFS